MKQTILLFAIFSLLSIPSRAQENPTWQTPMHEVKLMTNGSEEAIMKVDPGYNYADLSHEGRNYRILYIYSTGKVKHARIIDQDSKLQIARGKGSYFWGNARFEFIDGEVFKLKSKRTQTGYEIIGPYGPLFAVENFGIRPVKTLNEKDFLAQAVFVFDRIKSTQKPPADVIYISTAAYNFNNDQ
jgi:hypothetical protein